MNRLSLVRLGRGGGVGLTLALALGSPLFGGAPVSSTAYFSLEGDVVTAGDALDLHLDLTRSVGSGEDLGFRTWASGGGTNAAGDVVASGGIDSVLELFDSGDASRAFNDDEIGLDSLISWSPTQTTGTPLNPDPLAAGAYRLHLNEFGNNATGAWALDLVGPADALQLNGVTPTGTGTIRSLKFGTDGAGTAVFNSSASLTIGDRLVVGQSGAAELNHTAGTLTTGRIDVGGNGLGVGTFNIDGAAAVVTQTGSSLNIGAGSGSPSTDSLNVQNGGVFNSNTGDFAVAVQHTGAIHINDGGTFNANGRVVLNEGTLTRSQAGTFNLAAGQQLLALDGAAVTFTGSYELDDGTNFDIDTNTTFTVTSYLDIGNGTDGTLLVRGNGAQLITNTTSSSFLDWGLGGGTALVTIRNGASASIGAASIFFARNGNAGSSGTLNVQTAATMTANSLNLATGAAGAAEINVSNAGSSLTQNGAATLAVGGTGSSTAIINVTDSGAFTTGTGVANINATGTIDVNTGGTFNAKGTTHVNAGGTLNVNAGGTLNLDGTALNLDASANFDAAGGTVFVNNGGSFNGVPLGVTSFGTLRVENSGVANLPGIVSADILIQDSGILNASADTSSQFFVNDVQNFDNATFNGSFGLGLTLAGGSTASMTLGTNDVLTVKGISSVGYNKTASLSVNDGTFNADGGLVLGSTLGGGGGKGTVTINAGTLHAADIPGSLGSPAIAVGGFPVSGNANTDNALILNDGELNVDGIVYIAPGNSFTMVDGDLDAAVLVNQGTLNITGGNIRLNTWINGGLFSPAFGVVDIGAATLTIGTPRTSTGFPLSLGVLIGSGESLTAASVDVGVDVGAGLGITGGGVVTSSSSTSNVGDGGTGGSAGTVTITGANSAWNVGGGGLDIDRGSVSVGGLAQLNATGPGGQVDIFANGVLRGNGSVTTQGGVFNEGTIIVDEAVEDSTIYLLAINGDYTQDPTGRIEIGMVSGDPRLEVMYVTNGLMSLAGELAFDPADDYSGLDMYTSYSVLFGNGTTTRSGVFDMVTGANLGDGTGLGIIYGGSVVNALHAINGDLNFDGFVGISDLNIVLGNWNQNVDAGVWGGGDPSGDGFVGIEDLNVVLGNWNAGTPPGDVAALVPEPGTVGVMGVLWGGLLGQRSRGRDR